MIVVDVKNLAKTAISAKSAKSAAAEVIEGEAKNLFRNRDIEVSIAFVGSRKIREINKKYRKIDSATDVLSFMEDDSDAAGLEGCPIILGELVICPQKVKKVAQESGVAIKDEFSWVVVHGMLHLFGYDQEKGEEDAKKMREKEKFYLSKIKLKSAKLKAQSVK